jgi:putative nucleotide binding protein
VLDFFPSGKPGEATREPVVQMVGEQYFTLLEASLKPDAKAKTGDRLYLGKGERDLVSQVKGRIQWPQLSAASQRELEPAVRKIVTARETEFVNFLNRAGAVSIRLHTLELLPSIGKKHLASMLDARERKPFLSFEDVHQRVPHLGNPADLFVQRIVEELRGESKYYLFTKPPAREEEEGGYPRRERFRR